MLLALTHGNTWPSKFDMQALRKISTGAFSLAPHLGQPRIVPNDDRHPLFIEFVVCLLL